MEVLSLWHGSIKAPSKPETMREIATRMAAKHRLTLEQIRAPDRAARISHPRQEAMYLMRVAGNFSLSQIGRYFGKHHSTVLNAVRTHAERMK